MNDTISYPWYKLVAVDESLAQGDIIRNCQVLVPVNSEAVEKETIAGEVLEYDVIVMSQSCDLENKKIDLVLVCPIYSLDELSAKQTELAENKGKNQLRKGMWVHYHLLNRCNFGGFEDRYIVVDFKNVYGVPFDFLADLIKRRIDRVRLLPPYREHLSQSFARFFMRVGLPIDIPEFK